MFKSNNKAFKVVMQWGKKAPEDAGEDAGSCRYFFMLKKPLYE